MVPMIAMRLVGTIRYVVCSQLVPEIPYHATYSKDVDTVPVSVNALPELSRLSQNISVIFRGMIFSDFSCL